MRLFITVLLLVLSFGAEAVDLNIGGVGDGVTDETSTVQTALTDCSTNSKTCVVEAGKNYKVTGALYMWGAANLVGGGSNSQLTFALGAEKYPMRIGLSAHLTAAAEWTGRISGLKLVMTSGSVSGRLIWLARSNNASIIGNSFYPGNLQYSLTGSSVDGSYLVGAGNYIRSNVTITDNLVYATSNNAGSEGIGLDGFSTAYIARNDVSGVGDDLIGIHLECTNITIEDNVLAGVDGRIFISNSNGIIVRRNRVSRMASRTDGTWYAASSLLFIGHETAATNANTAPKNIVVQSNVFTYPEGSKDSAAAIYMQGPRDTRIENNSIFTNSTSMTGQCIYQVPFTFSGTWTDPDGLDTNPAKVRNLSITNNRCAGSNPRPMIMTGPGSDHIAPITMTNNAAVSTSYYSPAVVVGQIALAATDNIAVKERLELASPLRRAGKDLGLGPVRDFRNRVFLSPPSIGAFEVSSGDGRTTAGTRH